MVAEQSSEGSWIVDGSKVSLFHATKIPAEEKQKKKLSFSESFASIFGKKKELSWFYSVAGDQVIIKAGKLTFKSRIHSADKHIKFIRVPRLGCILVEKNVLRRPMSGEELLVKKYLAKH